jgi:hypothetical protein
MNEKQRNQKKTKVEQMNEWKSNNEKNNEQQ